MKRWAALVRRHPDRYTDNVRRQLAVEVDRLRQITDELRIVATKLEERGGDAGTQP